MQRSQQWKPHKTELKNRFVHSNNTPMRSLVLQCLLYICLSPTIVFSVPIVLGYHFIVQQTNTTSHTLACHLHGLEPTAANVRLPNSAWSAVHATAVVTTGLSLNYVGRKNCCACTLICEESTCMSLGYGCLNYQNLNGIAAHKALKDSGSSTARLVFSCTTTHTVSVPSSPTTAPSVLGMVVESGSSLTTPEAAIKTPGKTRVHIFGNNFGNDANLISVFLGSGGPTMAYQCTDVQVCHGICISCSGPSDCLSSNERCVGNTCLPKCSETPERECPCGLKCGMIVDATPMCVPPMGCQSWLLPSSTRPTASNQISCSLPPPEYTSIHLTLTPTRISNLLLNTPIQMSNVEVFSDDDPLFTFDTTEFQCSSTIRCNDYNTCTKDTCLNNGLCKYETYSHCSVGAALLNVPSITVAAKHYMMARRTINLGSIVLMDDKINAMLPGFDTNAIQSNAGSVDDTPAVLVDIGFPFVLFQQSARSKIYLNPNGIVQRELDTPCGSRFTSSLTQIEYKCTLLDNYVNMLLPLCSDFDPSSSLQSKIKYNEMTVDGVSSLAIFFIKIYPYASTSNAYSFGTTVQKDGTIRYHYIRTHFPINQGQSLQGIRGPSNSGLDWLVPGNSIHDGSEITYCRMPSVACLTPACGTSGTTVKFQFTEQIQCGGHLDTTKFKCRFGDTMTSATLVDPNTVACVVPALPGSMFASGSTTIGTVHVNLMHDDFESLSIMKLTTELGSFTFTYSNNCNGADQLDRCGGPGSSEMCTDCGACSTNPTVFKDCQGVCYGDFKTDCNGICAGTAVTDCKGVCGGTATAQECATVLSPSSSTTLKEANAPSDSNTLYPSPSQSVTNIKGRSSGAKSKTNNNETMHPHAQYGTEGLEIVLVVTVIGLSVLLLVVCTSVCGLRTSTTDGEDEDNYVFRTVVAGLRSNSQGGLSKKTLKFIPILTFSADSNIGEYGHGECAICLNDFEIEDRLRKLPCAHRFHVECVDPWFARHTSCPTCKADIREGLRGLVSADAGAVVPSVPTSQHHVNIELTEVTAGTETMANGGNEENRMTIL